MTPSGSRRPPSPSSISLASGRIELVIGPMFAGKTAELFRRLKRAELANRHVALVKYAKDTRYAHKGVASTHDLRTWEDSIPCNGRLSDIAGLVGDAQVVGVDEGQFFSDLAEQCEAWANQGRHVVVAALDGTFERKPFGQVCEMVPLAESITKLSAVCMMCRSRDAHFSLRIGREKTVEHIGGKESYRATCRACYAEGASVNTPSSS